MTDKQMIKLTEMLERMSLADRKKFVGVFEDTKTQFTKVETQLGQFGKLVEEWGYGSVKDFLMTGEFLRNPNKRRPRTVISDETRQSIIGDLRSGSLKTWEISEKHNVPMDSIYNIKSKSGLTKVKGKVVTGITPSSTEIIDKVPLPLAT
jgi:hypothetical protein